MLIPYSTDAPIYHYPIATVSLIVINVLFFFAFCTNRHDEASDFIIRDENGNVVTEEELDIRFEEIERQGGDVEALIKLFSFEPIGGGAIGDYLILDFGQGYKPWQWLTAMFMHLDLLHLIGNMIFLWSFGLVVEGKLGNVVFPLVYLAMGIVQAIIVQTLMWFSVGGALGASGAIFSVLALIVIFAPVNNFDVLFFMVGRFGMFELPIMVFGFIYVVFNFLGFVIGGSQMSSEALHLVGFAVGIPVGLMMLYRNLVDCEGYDLISYFQGRQGAESTVGKKISSENREARRAPAAKEKPPTLDKTCNLFHSQIDIAIAEQQYDVAVALQQKLSREVPGSVWKQPQLAAVIQGYMRRKDYAKALPLIERHVNSYEANRSSLQITMLKLWLQGQRPRHALRYIDAQNLAFMTDDERAQFEKLAAYARKQIKSGVADAV